MNNFQTPPASFLLQRQEEIKVTSDGGIILSSGHQGSGWSEEATGGPERINGILSHSKLSISWCSSYRSNALSMILCQRIWVRMGLNQKALLKPGTEEVSVSFCVQMLNGQNRISYYFSPSYSSPSLEFMNSL